MTVRRIYPAVGASSLAFLVLAVLLGLYQSVARDGALPGIGLDYMPGIRASLERGDADAALEQLHAAIVLDPGNTAVAALLARLAAERGDSDDEILALRRVLRQSPQDADARTRLAAAFLGQARSRPAGAGRSRAAVRAAWQAEKALEFAPGSAAAHRVAAEAFQLLGQDERAQAHLAALASSAATPPPAGVAREARP